MNRYLAILTLCFCFGLVGIFVKLIDAVPIMSLNFFRFFIGFLFMAMVIPFVDHKAFHNIRSNIKHYLAMGFLLALHISFYNASFLYQPVSNVVMISSVSIIFISIMSYLFLKEKITKKEMVVMLIGIIGLGIIYPLQQGQLTGILLVVFSSLMWAFLMVYMRNFEKTHTVGSVFWILLFGSLFLSPFLFYYGLGSLNTFNIYYLVLLGVICTGLPYIMLAYVLERTEAEKTSLVMLITVPLFAVTIAYLLLEEIPAGNVLFGGSILLLSGLYLRMGRS